MTADALSRLTAGLERDAQLAQATGVDKPPGEHTWVYAEGRISSTNEYGALRAEVHYPPNGPHIARHDPARVLRYVEAIRRVIARRQRVIDLFRESAAAGDVDAVEQIVVTAIMAAHNEIIADLASIYTEDAHETEAP
ncbi:DUF6221 family protein [Nocardia sp. NPDC051463]|uniref:DUF6221 family protein n=1 Tax=Nocardia sp. NPDC051463 TaxID=3154845 RepID=UPI00344BA5E5